MLHLYIEFTSFFLMHWQLQYLTAEARLYYCFWWDLQVMLWMNITATTAVHKMDNMCFIRMWNFQSWLYKTNMPQWYGIYRPFIKLLMLIYHPWIQNMFKDCTGPNLWLLLCNTVFFYNFAKETKVNWVKNRTNLYFQQYIRKVLYIHCN